MKTLLIFLLLTTAAFARPCDDARQDFNRAKKYGAYSFRCTDRYDGSSTATWYMDDRGYERFKIMEKRRERMERRKDK